MLPFTCYTILKTISQFQATLYIINENLLFNKSIYLYFYKEHVLTDNPRRASIAVPRTMKFGKHFLHKVSTY